MTFAYVPDALADDPHVPLHLRVLIELQRRGAALDWTAPVSATQLAQQFDRSRSAVSRALARNVAAGYILRDPVSLPRGGRGARYRVPLDKSRPALSQGTGQ